MSLSDAVISGLRMGERQVRARVEREAILAAEFVGVPAQGYLILEGDSWYRYPLYNEVTEVLRDTFKYKTRSVARHGETAQEMAYLEKQLRDLEAEFRDLDDDKHVARAILLSCGGNDIMDALAALMNPKGSGADTIWHPAVLQAVVHEQIPFAIATLVARCVALSKQYFKQVRPILIHGYGAPCQTAAVSGSA